LANFEKSSKADLNRKTVNHTFKLLRKTFPASLQGRKNVRKQQKEMTSFFLDSCQWCFLQKTLKKNHSLVEKITKTIAASIAQPWLTRGKRGGESKR
jgi:hypothetical protein